MAKYKIANKEVVKVLKAKYKNRGNINFYFRVNNIELPIGNRQLGRVCAKLSRGSSPLLERVNSNTRSRCVYKTRFGVVDGKKG